MIIKLRNKPVNIDGLDLTEKKFCDFFGKLKPWRDMQVKDRIKALKEDYKTYVKNRPKKANKGAE